MAWVGGAGERRGRGPAGGTDRGRMWADGAWARRRDWRLVPRCVYDPAEGSSVLELSLSGSGG